MPGTKITINARDKDPDPAPYLFVSAEIKLKIVDKPYDPTRSVYVPHLEEKFAEGVVEETNNDKVKVKIIMGADTGQVKEFKQEVVTQVSWALNY